MAKFLIDVNLPYHFSIWQGENFIHQFDLGDTWPDKQIWEYGKENNLTIVTKDADFSNEVWDEIIKMNKNNKLLSLYKNKIEAISVK